MMNKKYIIVILSILFGFVAKAQQTKPAQKTFPLSIIDSIKSTALAETRIINIALPDGYSGKSDKKYPVIYILDGGVEEDFIHLVGLVKYNTTSWVNRFPESIVVGIENTHRQKDFTFGVNNLDFLERIGFKPSNFKGYGGSANFISFLGQELQPYIDKNYQTTTSKTVIGESLAGLLATEILIKKPQLFDTYIIIDPSLWWGKESLLTEAPTLLQHNQIKLRVYVGAANKDESKIMYEDAVNLAELLAKYGNGKINLYFDYLPDETHATAIHQAVYNAFKVLNKK